MISEWNTVKKKKKKEKCVATQFILTTVEEILEKSLSVIQENSAAQSTTTKSMKMNQHLFKSEQDMGIFCQTLKTTTPVLLSLESDGAE